MCPRVLRGSLSCKLAMYTCMHIYVYIYACMHVRMYMCMYMCMCVYVYIYAHLSPEALTSRSCIRRTLLHGQ